MQRRSAGGRPARAGSGSGGRPARAGGGGGARPVQGTTSTRSSSGGAGPRVAAQALVLADGHYIYTPRNISGTAQAEMQHYELQPPMRKSLAKSAREAAEANEALAAANRKRGCMPKEVRTASITDLEAVMGFAALKTDGEMRV